MQEMDVQTGMAEDRAAELLPSEGENRMVHMGMEKVTDSDRTLSVSPVLLARGQWGRVGDGTEGTEGERVPLLEGDGTQLVDMGKPSMHHEAGTCCAISTGMCCAIRMEICVSKRQMKMSWRF